MKTRNTNRISLGEVYHIQNEGAVVRLVLKSTLDSYENEN